MYEKEIINRINTLIYNTTQSETISRDRIIDSLINIIRDYNYSHNDNVQIIDWRKSK